MTELDWIGYNLKKNIWSRVMNIRAGITAFTAQPNHSHILCILTDADNKGAIICNANLSRQWSCHGNHDFVCALPCRADHQICLGGCCSLWYEWITQCTLRTLTNQTSDSMNHGLKNKLENHEEVGAQKHMLIINDTIKLEIILSTSH